MKSLFDHYPQLGKKLPHKPLGQFPTPVKRLELLGERLGIDALYLKDDGLSGKLYGGSKVRKLEFLLGQALRRGAKNILTFGYAGSNHTVASAIYAKQLGLRTTALLLPQPNAHYVRTNLMILLHCGTEFHYYPNTALLALGASYLVIAQRIKHSRFPEIIWPGGSSSLGITGLVNAVYELKEQIELGLFPEPDHIYVAAGTMGTAVGLLIGICATGLRTGVTAVSVLPGGYVNINRLARLFRRTNTFLHRNDASFPLLDFPRRQVQVRHEFVGLGYAHLTPECVEAMQMIEKDESILLEGTYTGKSLAALITDARRNLLSGKTVLFWNTYNGQTVQAMISGLDYHDLPHKLHFYFEPLGVTP